MPKVAKSSWKKLVLGVSVSCSRILPLLLPYEVPLCVVREGFVLLLRGGSSKPLLTELAEEPEAFLWHALLLVLLSHVAQICVLLPEVLATHFTNKWPLLCPTGYHMVSVPTLLAKWVATLGAFLFRAKWYIMLVKPVEVHRPLLIRTVPTVIDPAVMLVPTLMLSAKVAPQ